MSPASPGPVQTEASCCVKVTKALGLIFLLFFFGCSFSSPLSSPLVLDSFHLPLSLEHCLTVHLFSLCMLSLPPLFTFISRLLFFIQFPLVFFEFFSSSSLLCSSPILSTCLPIQNAAGGGLFPIRSVLSCLLEFPSPLCFTGATFFNRSLFPFADHKPGHYFFFTTVGFIHLGIFPSQETE